MDVIGDKPTKPPLYKIGDMIMAFGVHYPVSGEIKDMRWHIVNLEWEYFIENDDGFGGKIKESKILKFDKNIWDIVKSKWDRYLSLMKEAEIIELECRKLLSRGKYMKEI